MAFITSIILFVFSSEIHAFRAFTCHPISITASSSQLSRCIPSMILISSSSTSEKASIDSYTRLYMSANNNAVTINSTSLTIDSSDDSSTSNPDTNRKKLPFIENFRILMMAIRRAVGFRLIGLTQPLIKLKEKLNAKKELIASKKSKGFLNSQRDRRPTPANSFISGLLTSINTRSFWTRSLMVMIGIVSFKNYLRYIKSLTLVVPYSEFLKCVEMFPERIANLRVIGTSYLFQVDGKDAMTRPVNIEATLLATLLKSGIDFWAPAAPINLVGIISSIAYLAFLLNLTNKMTQGPSDGGIGKAKNELSLNSISFADVAGQDKAKTEVKEICDMLKSPEKFLEIGARLPSGVLLCGPPGTGKTLLARVSAAEAGVPFFSVSASEFVEVFVGRGAARVRKLFKIASENAPSIIFIDELDSIGRSRRSMSMNSEQENTLNQLLTCMDGLDTSNNGVIVMAATNRQELLDSALLRAGRFDRIVQCPLPDKTGRLAILKVHTKSLRLDAEVNLDKVARLTPGLCGADLAAIANEAAIRAVRRAGNSINAEDFDNALATFYAGRGTPLAGLAEQLPSWLKGLGPQGDMSSGVLN